MHSTARSEEHTSELQSPDHLVCRLLLEKKKKKVKCIFVKKQKKHKNEEDEEIQNTHLSPFLVLFFSFSFSVFSISFFFFFFFFNDTATTEIYTLSLHDALPICLEGETRYPRGRRNLLLC